MNIAFLLYFPLLALFLAHATASSRITFVRAQHATHVPRSNGDQSMPHSSRSIQSPVFLSPSVRHVPISTPTPYSKAIQRRAHPFAVDNATHLTTVQSSSTSSVAPSPTPPVDPSNGHHTSSSFRGQPLVQVDFNCTIDAVFCAKVLRAIDSAAQEFTKVVNINVGILLKVSYYNFCDKQCANTTYGWGVPTSQFTLTWEDAVDTNYVYPQTLAKQLAYRNVSVWADHDVDIELNHDAYMSTVNIEDAISRGWNQTGVPPGGKYWFEGDPPIEADQIDMTYIVLHELLHGIGFISSWGAYFWTESSPFRSLIDGIIDTELLQLVTPGPYWSVKKGSGPVFINGFQPTMIFDKFLSIVGLQNNVTSVISLADTSFAMQNFCRRGDQAFIVNFVRDFSLAGTVSLTARNLFNFMSQKGTLFFNPSDPSVANSPYITQASLQPGYSNLTLMTGDDVMQSQSERFGRINNRPGLSISHVDDSYSTSPDFLMTQDFITGQTLQQIVNVTNANRIAYRYNDTLENGTVVELSYRSPIGPGILRMLDAMGYSTVLVRTNYTSEGSVHKPKVGTQCDDANTNSRLNKPEVMASSATWISPSIYWHIVISGAIPCLLRVINL